MGICLKCGKKSLFLKINENGRCKNCESSYQAFLIAEEKREKTEALNLYFLLSKLYFDSQESIPASDDPVENLNCISLIEDRISKCNLFLDTLEKCKEQKYFLDILNEKCDFNSKSDRYLKYAYFEHFNLKILIHKHPTLDPLIDLFINELRTNTAIGLKQWDHSINRINKYAQFEKTLYTLSNASISPENQEYPNLSVSDLIENVKYSRVTSKTNFHTIGSFVAIDIETTGLHCQKNEIIEISAIRFEDWTPIEKFHSMVKPKKEIPHEITNLTGITNQMVADAPSFKSIIPSLFSFIGKSNIIGYNLPFDLKFLYHYGFDFTSQKRKYYDVLDLAQSMLKKPKMKWDREFGFYEIDYNHYYDVEDHKLTTICKHYEIRDNASAHRSTSDALATGLVFMKLVKERTSAMGNE